MNDLNAPHNTTVIVERGSERAVANYTNGAWFIGPIHLTLKERLDFTPNRWYHVQK